MIFMTEILYLVFVIFSNEAIAQFRTLMHAISTYVLHAVISILTYWKLLLITTLANILNLYVPWGTFLG